MRARETAASLAWKFLLFAILVNILVAVSCTSCAHGGQYALEPNMNFIKEGIARNVWITVKIKDKEGEGRCSGVIYQTNLIITARHCKGDEMWVDGVPAKVLRESTEDLLLLEAETGPYEPLKLNTRPVIGDKVFSVSNYHEYKSIVSIGRIMRIEKDRIFSDVLCVPGVSGSALYNRRGELIGINNQFYGTDLPNGRGVIVFGSAVHARHVKDLLK
jgi:S1-C subfamily serine protease